MGKTALITGVTGQAGSTMADFLLAKDYKVVGLIRRSSNPDLLNIKDASQNPNLTLEEGDLCDTGSLVRVVDKYKPDELYNFAAMSQVGSSWQQPIITCDINFTGVARLLEAVRLFSPKTKVYHSSTSECYGDVISPTQDMDSPLRPRSPYAASKIGAEFLCKTYADSYNLFTCYSRNFNFEGTRRSKQFVTRKITDYIGDSFNKVNKKIKVFNEDSHKTFGVVPMLPTVEDAFNRALNDDVIKPLHLGNIEAKRDWSDCRDTIRGIWLMMQRETPDNYVFGTGTARSVREFLTAAFKMVGITDWTRFVKLDESLIRPAEVNLLCCNYSKAKAELGWQPEISFEELVKSMVKNDIGLHEKD